MKRCRIFVNRKGWRFVHLTLDELIEYDFDEQQAQQMIESVSEKAQANIDWNKVWSKNTPFGNLP